LPAEWNLCPLKQLPHEPELAGSFFSLLSLNISFQNFCLALLLGRYLQPALDWLTDYESNKLVDARASVCLSSPCLCFAQLGGEKEGEGLLGEDSLFLLLLIQLLKKWLCVYV
jgi:hypothetical protein